MDVSSPTAILGLVLPKVPFLFRTAIWHSFWQSPTSTKWDLKTELIVRMIRELIDSPHPKPALTQQRNSLHDPGIKGKMWISKVTFPPPEQNEARQLLLNAIEDLDEGAGTYVVPQSLPVEAEWTGYRANVDAHRPRPDLSEAQHYTKLMAEVTSDVTILYFHGGAYYLMDPATHRGIVSHLAQPTGGRALSVRYRLSPQNAFPAALLDALIAYLSLLYPPPSALHSPVSPSNIILAGDSAGGNLSLALLQLLLQINRPSPSHPATIHFHTHTINLPIPLPAACATISPWTDMTRAMPSITSNFIYDYLPPPLSRERLAQFPKDDIWPTDPPRGDLYCETNMLCHPLTSPLAAKDWTGSCPLWFAYGEEMLLDEGKQVAAKAARQGVKVVWEQWEAMPHTFAVVLPTSMMAKKCYSDWAAFCRDVVGGEGVETGGRLFEVKTGREREVDVRGLAVMDDEEVRRRMGECQEKRHFGVKGEGKVLPSRL